VPAAVQASWHVDVNGAPPGTGTFSESWTSPQQAATQPLEGIRRRLPGQVRRHAQTLISAAFSPVSTRASGTRRWPSRVGGNRP